MLIAGLMLLAPSSLGETGAAIGPEGRLMLPDGEPAGIGENVQSIVAETDAAVYFTQGPEAGAAEAVNSLWVYRDGAVQRVSDLASNAVYDAETGTIYFLFLPGAPQLIALDAATGQMLLLPLDLEDAAPKDPEIALADGGVTVYTTSESGERTVVAAVSMPAEVGAAQPTAEPEQNLSRGSKGENVRSVQQRLADLGYPTGTADGVFGYKTHQAVRYFQDALGQDQTGVVTPGLKAQILAEGAPEYRAYVALDRGSHGVRVEALQSRLNALNYLTGAVDGDYGARTAEAVRLFQKKAGLGQTGAASVETLKALTAKNAPVYSEYLRLEKGNSGSRVKKLQERLYKLGYYAGARDGNYDSRTAEAVKQFQSAIGVKQTGAANEKLQKRLFASGAPKCKAFIELKYGDTGTRVKELQKRIKALGYYDGEIGGHFRSKTRNGVKAFQKAIGVKQTGVATVCLLEKLFAADAPSAANTPAPTSAPTPTPAPEPTPTPEP